MNNARGFENFVFWSLISIGFCWELPALFSALSYTPVTYSILGEATLHEVEAEVIFTTGAGALLLLLHYLLFKARRISGLQDHQIPQNLQTAFGLVPLFLLNIGYVFLVGRAFDHFSIEGGGNRFKGVEQLFSFHAWSDALEKTPWRNFIWRNPHHGDGRISAFPFQPHLLALQALLLTVAWIILAVKGCISSRERRALLVSQQTKPTSRNKDRRQPSGTSTPRQKKKKTRGQTA